MLSGISKSIGNIISPFKGIVDFNPLDFNHMISNSGATSGMAAVLGLSGNSLEKFLQPIGPGSSLLGGVLSNFMDLSLLSGALNFSDDNDSTSLNLNASELLKLIAKPGQLQIKVTMGGGNDTFTEDFYSSTIHGGDGNDKISAGAGDDVINGGRGKDVLTGGAGKDTFVFDTKLVATEVDTITDFNGAQDVIHLDNAIFKAIKGTGTLTAAQFVSNKTGTAADASDRIIYETDTGYLSYDADGNGSGAAVKFAQLKAGTALNNADFFVI